MKLCKKCGIEKPLSEMVKSSNMTDGYLYKCKKCQLEYRMSIRHQVIPGEYQCTKCNTIKQHKEFPKNPRKSNGLNSQCSECTNTAKNQAEHWKKYNIDKKNRLKNDSEYKKYINEQKRNNARKNVESRLLRNAKIRSIKKGYDFNLTIEDIVVPQICPILKMPIIPGIKGNYEYTASIDRIDNSKGYTKDNIQIISKKANSMKNSATSEELIKFANWINNNIKI